MARLNLDLEGTIYQEYRTRCSTLGMSMSDVTRGLIGDFLTAEGHYGTEEVTVTALRIKRVGVDTSHEPVVVKRKK